MVNQTLSARLQVGVAQDVVPGTSAGLVPASGLPGNTTGSAAPAGTVGEVTQGSGTATGSTSYTGLTSTVLTPGVWVATAVVQATGGSSGGSYVEAIINQTQNSGTGTQGYNYVRGSVGSTGEGSAVIPFYLINIPQGSGSQTYWLNCRTDHTAASDIAYRVNYVRIY